MTKVLHSAPPGAALSTIFSVTVDGTSSPVYVTPLGHFTYFSTDEDVDIVVGFNATITSAKVTPLECGVSSRITGDDLSFSLMGANKNGYYSVEINDPNAKEESASSVPLFIFSDALDTDVPSAGADAVVLTAGWWYVDGSGNIRSGTSTSTPSNVYYNVAQGKTLYVSDGAILRGKIRVGSDSAGGSGVTAATIRGRGIVDASSIPATNEGRPLRVNHSSGVLVDGPIFLGGRHWGVVSRKSHDNTFRHIKVVSWRVSGAGTPDGIDMVGSHTTTIEDFFVRAYDDGVTVKSSMSDGTWEASSYGITYQRGVIYNGWAGNAMTIGYETASSDIHHIALKDIVVVNKLSRSDPIHRAALSIYNDEAGDVHDVSFENIVIESCEENFIDVEADDTGEVLDVDFINVRFHQAATDLPIVVKGVAGGTVDGVRFHGLTFDDGATLVDDRGDVDLKTNAHATNITFSTARPGPKEETLNPVADVWVRGNGTQSGTATSLEVKNSPNTDFDRYAYLRFDATSLGWPAVDRAILRVYCEARDGTTTISVYPVTSDTWTERMTYAGKPGNGSPIQGRSITATGWYEYDVTSHVNAKLAGNDLVSFLLYSSSVDDQLIKFTSRRGTNKPELVLTR